MIDVIIPTPELPRLKPAPEKQAIVHDAYQTPDDKVGIRLFQGSAVHKVGNSNSNNNNSTARTDVAKPAFLGQLARELPVAAVEEAVFRSAVRNREALLQRWCEVLKESGYRRNPASIRNYWSMLYPRGGNAEPKGLDQIFGPGGTNSYRYGSVLAELIARNPTANCSFTDNIVTETLNRVALQFYCFCNRCFLQLDVADDTLPQELLVLLPSVWTEEDAPFRAAECAVEVPGVNKRKAAPTTIPAKRSRRKAEAKGVDVADDENSPEGEDASYQRELQFVRRLVQKKTPSDFVSLARSLSSTAFVLLAVHFAREELGIHGDFERLCDRTNKKVHKAYCIHYVSRGFTPFPIADLAGVVRKAIKREPEPTEFRTKVAPIYIARNASKGVVVVNDTRFACRIPNIWYHPWFKSTHPVLSVDLANPFWPTQLIQQLGMLLMGEDRRTAMALANLLSSRKWYRSQPGFAQEDAACDTDVLSDRILKHMDQIEVRLRAEVSSGDVAEAIMYPPHFFNQKLCVESDPCTWTSARLHTMKGVNLRDTYRAGIAHPNLRVVLLQEGVVVPDGEHAHPFLPQSALRYYRPGITAPLHDLALLFARRLYGTHEPSKQFPHILNAGNIHAMAEMYDALLVVCRVEDDAVAWLRSHFARTVTTGANASAAARSEEAFLTQFRASYEAWHAMRRRHLEDASHILGPQAMEYTEQWVFQQDRLSGPQHHAIPKLSDMPRIINYDIAERFVCTLDVKQRSEAAVAVNPDNKAPFMMNGNRNVITRAGTTGIGGTVICSRLVGELLGTAVVRNAAFERNTTWLLDDRVFTTDDLVHLLASRFKRIVLWPWLLYLNDRVRPYSLTFTANKWCWNEAAKFLPAPGRILAGDPVTESKIELAIVKQARKALQSVRTSELLDQAIASGAVPPVRRALCALMLAIAPETAKNAVVRKKLTQLAVASFLKEGDAVRPVHAEIKGLLRADLSDLKRLRCSTINHCHRMLHCDIGRTPDEHCLGAFEQLKCLLSEVTKENPLYPIAARAAIEVDSQEAEPICRRFHELFKSHFQFGDIVSTRPGVGLSAPHSSWLPRAAANPGEAAALRRPPKPMGM